MNASADRDPRPAGIGVPRGAQELFGGVDRPLGKALTGEQRIEERDQLIANELVDKCRRVEYSVRRGREVSLQQGVVLGRRKGAPPERSSRGYRRRERRPRPPPRHGASSCSRSIRCTSSGSRWTPFADQSRQRSPRALGRYAAHLTPGLGRDVPEEPANASIVSPPCSRKSRQNSSFLSETTLGRWPDTIASYNRSEPTRVCREPCARRPIGASSAAHKQPSFRGGPRKCRSRLPSSRPRGAPDALDLNPEATRTPALLVRSGHHPSPTLISGALFRAITTCRSGRPPRGPTTSNTRTSRAGPSSPARRPRSSWWSDATPAGRACSPTSDTGPATPARASCAPRASPTPPRIAATRSTRRAGSCRPATSGP